MMCSDPATQQRPHTGTVLLRDFATALPPTDGSWSGGSRARGSGEAAAAGSTDDGAGSVEVLAGKFWQQQL